MGKQFFLAVFYYLTCQYMINHAKNIFVMVPTFLQDWIYHCPKYLLNDYEMIDILKFGMHEVCLNLLCNDTHVRNYYLIIYFKNFWNLILVMVFTDNKTSFVFDTKLSILVCNTRFFASKCVKTFNTTKQQPKVQKSFPTEYSSW